PIDVATGAFLITATDFVLPDIREDIRVQRKYNSTNKEAGILGPGWSFSHEGHLYRSGNRLHAKLDGGITALFEWDGSQAANITRGCEWLELTREDDGWRICDGRDHKCYHYDGQGLLTAAEDRNGQCVRLYYEGERLTRITTPLGYYLEVEIRDGRLIQTRDHTGRTVQYRYEDGLLSDVIHMDGGATHYEYDSHGYLERAVDQAKVAYLENRYDDAGRVVLQTLANGDTYRADYHPEKNRVTIASSVHDKTVEHWYNEWGEILGTSYQDGTRELYEYGGNGHRTSWTDRLGRKTTWKYDGAGRLTEEVQPDGLRTVHRYDAAGNEILRTDSAGRETAYEYDGHHNRIAERMADGLQVRENRSAYDWMGRRTEAVDGEGNRTQYQYGETGGKPSAIRFADGGTCSFEYDRAGRMMAQEDACGRTEYGYNARNKRALVRDGEGNETRWMYDGMGRLLALYPPKAWKEQRGEYSYSYDFLDRLVHTKNPDGGHERLMRDGEGNVLKRVHPNAYDPYKDDGEGTTYDYDSDGNNIRIHYPDGGCERIFYDSEGNRTRHVMPESYDPQTDDGEGWTYTYDACNRLTGVTGPDGVRQASYAYDLAGNLTEETDAQGRCTYRSYTAFGELKEQLRPVLEAEGTMLYEKTTWQYDRCGNVLLEQRHGGYWDRDGRLVEEDGAGLALRFTYDSRNRRTRVEDGLGAAISYRYDVQGKLVYEERAVSEEVRQAIHYRYDRAGRLTEQREELDSGLAPLEGEPRHAVTRCQYDENGNRTGIVTPEGYRILRSYDACGRLASERVIDDKNGIDRTTTATYDHAGNLTRIVRRGKGLGEWEQGYGYDLKDRIVHVEDCLGPVFSYEYDKNDRRIAELLPQAGARETGEPGCLKNQNRYRYDVYGRLLARTDGSGTVQEENRYLPDGRLALSRGADGQEAWYTYGVHGGETQIRTARSRREDRPAQQYRYDSRGRITGVANGNGSETGYDLDAWGRIRKIRQADGGEEGCTYDFVGNITSTRDANGGVTTYRYNSQGKVCEIIDQEGNSETFRYDREGRMALHVDRSGNEVRTTYNVDGNPVLEIGTDRNGESRATRSWEYDTSGNVRKAVAGGFCYTYEYRPDGKLLKKSASGRTLASCTYFSDGSLESLTDASGRPVFYEYDWRG
ncbi:DUF6531 domain-containing protein, partial [Acetivibrio ethanolgignens]